MKKLDKGMRNKDFGKGDWKAFFKLMPRIKLPWFLILIGFLVSISQSEVMARVPVSTAALFSGEFSGKALASAIIYNVLNFLLMIIATFITTYVGAKAVLRAQKILWGRMLCIDMPYYDSNNPSDLLSTITNDTDTAVNAIVAQLITLIPSLYYVFRMLSTLNNYDIRLLVSVLVLIPLNVIFVVIIGRWRYEVNANIFRRIGSLTGYLAERVANILLIRSYTNEQKELHNGIHAAKGLYDANLRAAKVNFVADGVSTIMEVLQRGVPIIFGVILLKGNYITMQQWIAFFLSIGLIITQVNNIVSIWNSIKTAQGAATRMIQILEAPLEKHEISTSEAAPKQGDIVFDHVSFSYSDKLALQDISLKIPYGKSTAIVGQCGSGKTTLLSLIERLYIPTEGSIAMGNEDISKIELERYRDCFAYVQQDAGIFSGSLRRAMTYGIKRAVTDEELMKAAKRTGAYDLAKGMPDGFDAILAISGRSVSGGQRQRIVLTREFLKNKNVLLMDEPTSALDAQSAREIQQTIFNLFAGKTLVFITHDLSMLSSVDQIIVLDNGSIVGCGTHKELMNSCKPYEELINARVQEEVFARRRSSFLVHSVLYLRV